MTSTSAGNQRRIPQPGEGGMDTPRLIAREDLVACLDRAATRKVTIISAPAGSGKTSLLRAWADRPNRAHRLAVVQVRRDQHDAQLFWLALLNAVRQASGTTMDEPSAATPDFNGPAMVDRVLAELAEHRGRIMLVIDDVHELASTEALAQLTRLLANLPSQAHAIVSTRRDLWLGLHQLRLADELAEIRAADLRFSEPETRELLKASGVSLSKDGAALLHRRTEGWAAGLRLAALSLAGHPDPERFVAEFSGSDRTVAEYLLAEMLDRPARRGPGSAAAHLPARPGQRRTGRPVDGPPGVGTDPARPGRRERVRGSARSRTDLVPLPPAVRGSAPAGTAPGAARRSAGAAPAGRWVVRPAWRGGRGHPAYPGGGRLA